VQGEPNWLVKSLTMFSGKVFNVVWVDAVSLHACFASQIFWVIFCEFVAKPHFNETVHPHLHLTLFAKLWRLHKSMLGSPAAAFST